MESATWLFEGIGWMCENTVLDVEQRPPDEWRAEIDKARGSK